MRSDDGLADALASGPDAFRARLRELAGGDAAAREAAVGRLLASAAPSAGRPAAAALLAQSGEAARAAEVYETWLEDAEAPPSWHLALLARAYAKLGDVAGVFRTAARTHPWDVDAESSQTIGRLLAKVRERGGVPERIRRLRVAVLGTFNTAPLLHPLRAAAARLDLDLDLVEGQHEALAGEVADPSSAFYAHDPEVVVLAAGPHDVRTDASAEAQADEWLSRVDTVLARTKAHVLLHTFGRAPHAPLGHLELRERASATRVAAEIERVLADRLPARASLVDCARAAARCGAAWHDVRQWHWANEAVSPAGAAYLAEEYAALLVALTGRTRKVLVLDLDHTLWGGIVGEDGVANLRVGPPSVEGAAHLALQRYAKALKDRGVLLAVVSKNDREDAEAPFRELREMALALEDFAAFRASWDPKADQVRQIAAELNLGTDQFVFLDDNPNERGLMRRALPEVLTIPAPADPAGFVPALDLARAFEALAVSDEDRERTAMYVAERRRGDVRAQASSPEAFWRSLEMVATVAPLGGADTQRIVQLAARSNQFNVTTWRMTAADVEQVAASPDHAGFSVRLRDRYGDYGLIAVLVLAFREGVAEVRQWCMSCRVLGRSVETLVLAELERLALARDCAALEGVYLPTRKNGMVRDLWPKLGFERVAEQDDGTTRWRRALDPSAPTVNDHVRVERPEGTP